MRYLILSDIHANWTAMQAVLNHVRRKRFDQVLFLGDAVGYGATPNQVINWLRPLGSQALAVRGNQLTPTPTPTFTPTPTPTAVPTSRPIPVAGSGGGGGAGPCGPDQCRRACGQRDGEHEHQ